MWTASAGSSSSETRNRVDCRRSGGPGGRGTDAALLHRRVHAVTHAVAYDASNDIGEFDNRHDADHGSTHRTGALHAGVRRA